MLFITETRTPLGRVEGFFGSVTKPKYIVRLVNSEIQVPEEGTHISFLEEEETGNSRVLGMSYDSQMSHHVPQLQMHFRSSQDTEPDRGAQGSTCHNSFNQPNYYPNASAPMMYQPQQKQLAIIPNVVPKLFILMIMDDLIMYLQGYLNTQMPKILQSGGLESLVVEHNCFNQQQHFGLPQPPRSEMPEYGTHNSLFAQHIEEKEAEDRERQSNTAKRRTSSEETGNSRKKRVLGRFSNHYDSQMAHHHHFPHQLPILIPIPRLNQTMNQQHQFTIPNHPKYFKIDL